MPSGRRERQNQELVSPRPIRGRKPLHAVRLEARGHSRPNLVNVRHRKKERNLLCKDQSLATSEEPVPGFNYAARIEGLTEEHDARPRTDSVHHD